MPCFILFIGYIGDSVPSRIEYRRFCAFSIKIRDLCRWILLWLKQSQWFWGYLIHRYVCKSWQHCLYESALVTVIAKPHLVLFKAVIINLLLLTYYLWRMGGSMIECLLFREIELFLICYYPVLSPPLKLGHVMAHPNIFCCNLYRFYSK